MAEEEVFEGRRRNHDLLERHCGQCFQQGSRIALPGENSPVLGKVKDLDTLQAEPLALRLLAEKGFHPADALGFKISQVFQCYEPAGANHADPVADWPATVLALGAQIKLVHGSGERMVSADDFFVDMMTTAMESHEILTEIHVPIDPPRSGSAYLKVPQPASGFALTGVAAPSYTSAV